MTDKAEIAKQLAEFVRKANLEEGIFQSQVSSGTPGSPSVIPGDALQQVLEKRLDDKFTDEEAGQRADLVGKLGGWGNQSGVRQ